MLKLAMTLEHAHEIAVAVTAGRRRYGAQYSSQFPKYTLEEALEVLEKAAAVIQQMGKDELTKANRQYAALNARYERCKKKNEPEG